MKTTVIFKVIIFLIIGIGTAFAEEQNKTCDNAKAYELATKAKQEFETKLNAIPGVLQIEVGTCSELESYGVSSEAWQCGVFLFFADDNLREVFYQTTGLWGGRLQFSNGSSVPLCSRTSQQVTTKGGLY